MPEKYGWPNGLTSDEYYQRLKKLEQQNKKSAKSKDGEGEKSKGDKQDATAGKDGDGTKEGDTGHVKPANKIMAGCCGGMTSSPISKVQEALQNTEKQGRSEAAVLEKIKQTAQAIKEHLQSLGRGNAAGAWSELIQMSDETFEVPWDVLLSTVLSQAMEQIKVGGSDYSMRRLSKRSYAVGFPRPGLVDYDPVLWLVVDSSGSMGTKQLGVALKVCADVIQQTGLTQVYYLDADAKVQREPIPVTAQDLYQMEILGRGGTDFRPAIEKAKKAIPRPDALVYLTDGDGTAPADAPEYIEVIWVVVPTSKTKPAAWGQTIYLK
jgi:predicted metal-dependent peptidase